MTRVFYLITVIIAVITLFHASRRLKYRTNAAYTRTGGLKGDGIQEFYIVLPALLI